jgi:hypothetical protein
MCDLKISSCIWSSLRNFLTFWQRKIGGNSFWLMFTRGRDAWRNTNMFSSGPCVMRYLNIWSKWYSMATPPINVLSRTITQTRQLHLQQIHNQLNTEKVTQITHHIWLAYNSYPTCRTNLQRLPKANGSQEQLPPCRHDANFTMYLSNHRMVAFIPLGF